MTAEGAPPRAFSDDLLQAAARIDELPREEVARLLVKAAIRLRVIQQTGGRLEHIPVAAYHLLRRVSRGSIPIASLHSRDDEAAVSYLLTRQLATASPDHWLTITDTGEELGEIAKERAAPQG
jgi:hypothetical protein